MQLLTLDKAMALAGANGAKFPSFDILRRNYVIATSGFN